MTFKRHVSWMFIGAGAVAFLVFSGCASRPHTYQPPNATKLNAARAKLSTDVDKATASAKKVQEHVQAAQVSAEKVAKFSGTIEVKLGELHGRVTAELRPTVEDIQADVAAEKEEETVLTGKLSEAMAVEKTQQGELAEAQTDKTELTKESQIFLAEAQKLADNATKENKDKISAETKLHWYRVHWFLGWAIFITGILACIALAVLKFMGKLAFL